MRFDKTVVLAAAAVATFGIVSSGAGSAVAQAGTAAPVSVASVAVSLPGPVSPVAPNGNDPWD